jgi:hypothetical protein
MVTLLPIQSSPRLSLHDAGVAVQLDYARQSLEAALAMRFCPPGLQGAPMMLADGVFYMSYRAGDLLGSAIYSSSPNYGFVYCVIAITVV